MGLFNIFNRRVSLTEANRELIFKLLGSFNANKIYDSNQSYIENGYQSCVEVYSLIRKITETFKSVGWVVEKKTKEGWEVVEGTELNALIEQPNKSKAYTWEEIQEMLIVYLLTTGNGYIFGENGFGRKILEVDVLPSQFITIESNKDFFTPELKYKFQFQGVLKTYDKTNVYQIKMFNPNYSTVEESQYGLSLIKVAAMAVKVSNDRWEADASLLQNRGATGIITDKSGRQLTEDEAKVIQSAWDSSNSGTHNFGKIRVSNKDLSYIPIGMSSVDLQLIDKGVVNLRALCNVFGLDSSLFNDPANKTYNNRLEAEKSLFTNVIKPLSCKVTQAYNQFITASYFPKGDYRLRQDFSNVECLQGDKKLEAEKDKIRVEGISSILSMPISLEAKKMLLQNEYDMSSDFTDLLTENTQSDGI